MRENNTKGFNIMVGVFLIMAVINPLGGIVNAAYLRITGEKTTGIITSYGMTENATKGGIYYTYSPIVSFKNFGNEVSAIANFNDSKKQFNNIGDDVVIYYDKNNPQKIMVDNIFSAYIDKLIKILIYVSIVVLPTSLLSLISIKGYGGVGFLTTEVPVKNKIYALLLGAVPTITAALWIFQYRFSKTENNAAYLVLSMTVIAIYLVVLVKTLISILGKSRNR